MELHKIIKLAKAEKWDIMKLSMNPNITIDIVIECARTGWHFTQPGWYFTRAGWYFDRLSANPGIKWQDILNNPTLPWNCGKISENPNITPEIVDMYPDFGWDYTSLSYNENFTLEYADKHRFKNWNYRELYKKENLQLYANINKNDMDYEMLSENQYLDVNFFLENLDKPWHFKKLSKNKNITFEVFKATINYPWKKTLLSSRINIDYQTIIDNPDMDFDIENYCTNNPHFQYSEIEKMRESDLAHVWSWISYRDDLTEEFVKENLDKPWEFAVLFGNSNISVEFIINNFKYDDKFSYLSLNPSLTAEIIENNPQIKWNYDHISQNLFSKDPILQNKKKEKNKEICKMIIKNAKNEDCVMHQENTPMEIIDLICEYL